MAEPRKELSIMTAGDDKAVDFKLVLIYGDSGTGKTTMGARAVPPSIGERVLIGLTEPNGLQSIKAANPKAQVVKIECLSDIEAFLVLIETEIAVAANEGRKPKWDWFVLDSLTDAQDIVYSAVSKVTGDPDWSAIIDRIKNVVRRIRDVKMNKVIICLQKTIYPDDKNHLDMIKVEPNLFGTVLPNKVISMANICGWVFRGKETGDYRVMFRGPRNFTVKGHPNLDDLEVPNIATWMPKITAAVDPAKFREYADGYSMNSDVPPPSGDKAAETDDKKTAKK
jgi:hypothetical protein